MGYKTERFTKAVDENLCCSICREVFKDPVSCKSGHTFCSDCIRQWLTTHNKCPHDNVPLNTRDLVRNLALQGIIDNLHVYCYNESNNMDKASEPGPTKRPRVAKDSNVEENCRWTGKLSDLTRHQLTCPFQLVRCPNSSRCPEIQRRKLEAHKLVCQSRIVMCGLCGDSVVYNKQLIHKKNDCPLELIPCENKCTTVYGSITKIQRRYMAEHVKSVCDEALLPCPFKDNGCSEKVLNKNMEKHLQNKIGDHLMLLANENKKLRSELAKAKESSRCYIWTIRNYPTKASGYETGICFPSPVFWLCGYKWMMQLYPNGKADPGNMTLMLNRVDDFQLDPITCEGLHAHVICSLSVLKGVPDENDYVRTFNVTMHKDVKNWMNGWSDFMPSDVARSRKYCNPHGILNIQITMQITYS